MQNAFYSCQFRGIWTYCVKVMDFSTLKNKMKYLLFWKIHNFLIACPKATKQNSWPPLCIELSMRTNFMASKPTF